MKKKAQITIYIYWFLAAVVLVTLAGLIAPMGVLFSSEMYVAGQDILNRANDSINNIQNETVRLALLGAVAEGNNAAEQNITMLSDIFQYSWVIVLVLSGIVAFLFTRQLVEYQGGGFT